MSTFSISENTIPKPNYEYITNSEDVGRTINEVLKHNVIEVDTETTGLDPYNSKISLVQIGVPGKSYVYDVRHDTEHSSVHIDQLKPMLLNSNSTKIIQNSVFDMKMLKVHAGYYPDNIHDTMLVEQLFNLGLTGRGAGLADLVKKYLGLEMTKEPAGTFQDYYQKFQPFQIEYAAADVSVLNIIKELQWDRVVTEGFENVCRLEFEFTKPMCEMELNGITVDADRWRAIMGFVEDERQEVLSEVHQLLATTASKPSLFGIPSVNVDSNKQLLAALYEHGVDLPDTSEGTLKRYKDVPVIKALLTYRKVNKLISTYGETLLAKINPVTGRLHTSFRQMVSTGRMSSSNPNLQNIPKKQLFRSCFVSRPGYKLITADMSGAELRILGNLSEDPVFMECFQQGLDLHSRSASEVFKVAIEEVDKAMRNSCKALSFGLCVDEDTELITDRGIIKIKDVTTKDSVAHDFGSNRIIDHKYMGEKSVFELRSKFGYTLNATEDHVIKIIDKNGNYCDKKLKDIDINKDLICLKSGANLFNDSFYRFKPFNRQLRTNAKEFIVPEILDTKWASFFGLLIAEGHFHKGRFGNYDAIQFGISAKDFEFIEYIDNLFSSLFDSYSKSINGTIVNYSINSTQMAHWLGSIVPFKKGNKTETVDIPMCVKTSPKEVQVAFIRTLFEGDGTIVRKEPSFDVSYSSMSLTLLKSLQLMLLNFGIVSKIRETPDKRYPKNKYYKLDIIGTSCKLKFMSDIGFITDRKNTRGLSDAKFGRSFFNINYPKDKLRKLQKKISLARKTDSSDDIHNCNRYLYNQINNYDRNYIGNSYFKFLANYDEDIKFINDNSIITLPIESIELVGKKRVYDISVKNHQYFLANGFVVHNCYGMSKYGLAARLDISTKEAEKLIKDYFGVFKAVSDYLDNSARLGVKNGCTITASGRKRFYNVPPFGHPDRNKIQKAVERKAKNAGIQGSNADTIKESMIYIVDRLEKSGLDAKLLLTVHDEVVVEASDDCVEEVAKIVSNSLVDGFGRYFTKICMESDSLIGPSWLKDSCSECGCCEMKFIPDEKYLTKLVCSKCGHPQE